MHEQWLTHGPSIPVQPTEQGQLSINWKRRHISFQKTEYIISNTSVLRGFSKHMFKSELNCLEVQERRCIWCAYQNSFSDISKRTTIFFISCTKEKDAKHNEKSNHIAGIHTYIRCSQNRQGKKELKNNSKSQRLGIC